MEEGILSRTLAFDCGCDCAEEEYAAKRGREREYCLSVVETVNMLIVVLALESWRKGNSNPSVESPVVDEQTMRSGHWLGSVLFVSFSALTLLVA